MKSKPFVKYFLIGASIALGLLVAFWVLAQVNKNRGDTTGSSSFGRTLENEDCIRIEDSNLYSRAGTWFVSFRAYSSDDCSHSISSINIRLRATRCTGKSYEEGGSASVSIRPGGSEFVEIELDAPISHCFSDHDIILNSAD